MDDILFTPLKISGIEIKNRLVRSATSERAATGEGIVTNKLIQMYERLVRGGAGMIVTGYAYVDPDGRCNMHQTGIHDDSTVPGLRGLVDRFHLAGRDGKIFIQLVHGGRQVRPYVVNEVVAPSPVPLGDVQPRQLTGDEIEELVGKFIEAAVRAKGAGFDGVQLHAAHGFLISQFISPFTNRRTDEWGGTAEKRWKFFFEILDRVKYKLGKGYPVTAKVNCSDFLGEKGLRTEEAARMLKKAQLLGLDAVEVSGGIADTPIHKGAVRPNISSRTDEAYFRLQSRLIKSGINIPVILVGGIRTAQVARDLIRDRTCDAVAMCRPFIREPDLPLKWKKGKTHARCVSCQGCMIDTGGITSCMMESV